jgi:cytochrome c-type biogenesis protein CcmE
MTPQAKKRLAVLLSILLIAGGMAIFLTTIFRQSMMFFVSPTELEEMGQKGTLDETKKLRLGGLVEKGSLIRKGEKITFKVTDGEKKIRVAFTGVTPDLFQEGKGVVAEGIMENGIFMATAILAKHDEKYTPIKLKNKP